MQLRAPSQVQKFLDSVLFSSAVRIFRGSVCMGFPFLTRTPNIWTLRYAHDKVVQNAFDTLENHMLLLFSFFSLKTLQSLLRRLTTGFWCHGRPKNPLKDRRIKFVLPHWIFMVPIASAVTILHGNGVLRETTAVLHMVRPRELHGKRKGRNVGRYIATIIDWTDVFLTLVELK